jgi:hypothetical protein
MRIFKVMRKWAHDHLGWHAPDGTRGFDGCSIHSTCRFCGKDVMQDSQGNWF